MAEVEQHRRLQIAYLTAEDPQSKYAWSGTTYYMAQALQKHCGDVHYLGPIMSFERRVIGRLMHEASRKALGKNIAYDRLPFVAKKQAKIASQRLASGAFNLIFAPIGPPEVALLETDIPIILALDITFALQHNYHERYSALLPWSVKMSNKIEEMAYQRASALIYPGRWSARSAIEDYHVDSQKVHIVPFGANLDVPPNGKIVRNRRRSHRCRLLFMGLGWERKGGDIAFETLLKLEEMGIEAELIVCGNTPPAGLSHERMKVIPFLNKHDEKQYEELEQLYTTSDFLLLPTRCDCFPIVFCEASAFGLPVVTAHTGGVSDAVLNGINGYVLPYEARGADYARVIAELFRDETRYAKLVESSRAMFENKYNWDVWGVTMNTILQHMAAPVPAYIP
ncbi:MAG TPA: glycosyltransferase family 4 protein [Ktedonobacteraceae bacterium]|nr:glycosyltransferase family 4 protein [Ktedonobacteraceae bacterium]